MKFFYDKFIKRRIIQSHFLLTDIFTYPTVFELSEYVTSIQKKDKKAQEKAQEKLNEDFEDISQIMDGIEKGEVSVDNALEYVNRLL